MPHQLTRAERDRIAQLLERGFDQEEIAASVARDPSTISRERERNSTGGDYLAAQAQVRAEQRRRQPRRRKMDDPQLNAAVRQRLAQGWSPEQIAGRLRKEHPDDPAWHLSPQTIYTWIAADPQRAHWESFLRRRGKRPARRRKPSENPARAHIADRPEVIQERSRLGDFEGDTVLGPPGTGGLVTLVDRRSRFTLLAKIPSKEARRVHRKVEQRLRELPQEKRHSLTLDHGTEFARCGRLEKQLGVALYFAEPGCPYQRGTNENTNGLLRQYYPKGTDFREISHHDVRLIENLINHRPRACLKFQTPAEVFTDSFLPVRCD